MLKKKNWNDCFPTAPKQRRILTVYDGGTEKKNKKPPTHKQQQQKNPHAQSLDKYQL